VVDMGDWDVEACGGTHLANTSEAGLIKIVGTERVQDGIERLIYAVGPYALTEVQRREAILMDAAELLGSPYMEVGTSTASIMDQNKKLKSQLEALRQTLSREKAETLIEDAKLVDGLKLVFYSDEVDIEFLIELGNALEEKEPDVVAVMLSSTQRRSAVKAGKGAMAKGIHAGKLTSELAKIIGGGGGGAPHFGQGGGGDPDKFREGMDEVREAVKKQLKKR